MTELFLFINWQAVKHSNNRRLQKLGIHTTKLRTIEKKATEYTCSYFTAVMVSACTWSHSDLPTHYSNWQAQIAKFLGPTWGPPGSCRPQVGPMLAPWTLLSGGLLPQANFLLAKMETVDQMEYTMETRFTFEDLLTVHPNCTEINRGVVVYCAMMVSVL